MVRTACVGVTHAAEDPGLRGLNVNENPTANFDVWQAVRLFSPAPDGAGVAVYDYGERIDIKVSVEQIRFGGRHWRFAFLKKRQAR
jgi:hypothetical protein